MIHCKMPAIKGLARAFNNSAPKVPLALASYRQFVVWKLEQKTGLPKPSKIPYNPAVNGMRASVSDPATWGDYSQAVAAMASGNYSGIGFVFTKADPFVFLDFDDCRDEFGNWIDGGGQWGLFNDCAWEYSQSGRGIHVIGRVADKEFLKTYKNKWARSDGGMNECYAEARFVAFGPTGWQGEPQTTDTRLMCFLPARAKAGAGAEPIDWHTATDAPLPGYGGPSDDGEMIAKACAGTASKFNNGPPFAALWKADPEALGKFLPDQGGKGRAFDHSGADLALMNALAWWTGCNPVRMWRLFSQSALYRPEKTRTALLALEKATASKAASGNYFKTRAQRMTDARVIGEGVEAIATPILTLDEMREKLVFIRTGNAVLNRDRKIAHNWQTAKNDYAASQHTFETGETDKDGQPKTKTVEALEAWRKTDGKHTVDEMTWQPGEAEFCMALDGQGTAYNTYTPMKQPTPHNNWQEWAKPFIDHVAYLLPVPEEASRFMQWLAHIVQRPHELPHTAYLFFTPTHGIGRGTLAEIMARVFRGYAAISVAPNLLIGDGFNGGLSRKLFATIDEVREGTRSPHSREAQTLKSRITEPVRRINPKYGVQSVEKNCTRWLFFSQYEDAIPFDNGDRRIVVIANPIIPASPDWFDHMRQCMDQSAFIASIHHYLATLDLTGFKAGAHALHNDAKRKALRAMEGPALRAAREFASTWGAALAAISDLRTYIGEDDWPKHSRAVQDLIKVAGMLPGGARVKIASVMETVLIVQPSIIAPDMLQLMRKQDMAAMILRARTWPQ